MKITELIQKYIGIFLILAIVAGSGMILYASKENKTSNISNEKIKVEIRGAVKNPGTYEMAEGERAEDLIKKAGGLASGANTDAMKISLATELIDGQKVTIPGGSNVTTATVTQKSGKININTASLSELDSLPGIGQVLGQRIIDYRNTNGGFKSIDEVDNIEGIGEKKMEDIRQLITI